MNIEEYIESGQLELYVLQQLSPAEAAEVEQLAAQHPAIRAELSRIEQTLGAYAEAHAVAPPAGMRERVLGGWQQAIRQQAPAEAAVPPAAAPQPTMTVSSAPQPEPAQRPAPAAAEPVVRTMPAPASGGGYRWLAAAAAVLLLLSVGANWLFYNRWQRAESQLVIAQSEQARYAAATQAVEKRLATRTNELAMLRDETYRTVVMTGTQIAPGARARVHFNPATKAVYVDVNNLPPAPEGKQYQLWALDKGKPVDAGMLARHTAAGDSLQRMKNIINAQAFAVTLEPAGGRPEPTLAALTVMGQMQ
ncbi:anti-sigma factor [Hymenobacter latericus]|uniref:anti-sigma factor n=1 Tax=Hymenobacter sp. YIM 151858-1 TaxID=2987688 RepID=UPI0022278021|nr:anti-sigma factor [Hymenobacter sp. YIM 151858-1]UYZ60494.1 anti-sigma factor [Hymenobacter sp. YIM 151858-1]